MADISELFKPADIATSSDAASDALSRIAAVSDAASDALSKAYSRCATVSNAASAAASNAYAVANAAMNAALLAGKRIAILKVYNEASAIEAGDGKMYFAIPGYLSGMNLISCGGHLYTAATSGVVAVQIANVTSAVDMLSAARKLEWDVTEKDTLTAGASSVAVINAANKGVAAGEEIRIDIDDAASGAKGLEIRLTFQTP